MRLVSLGCKQFYEAGSMFEYTFRTVSYAKELTSVYICYSQGNGLNTPLSKLVRTTVHTQVSSVLCSVVVMLVFRCSSVVPCSVLIILVFRFGNKHIICLHYLHLQG